MNKFTSMQLALERPKIPFLIVIVLLVSALTTSLAASSHMDKSAAVRTASALRTIAGNFEQAQLSFVPNAGQTDSSVIFQTHSLGGTLFFRPHEVVLSLPGQAGSDEWGTLAYGVSLRFEAANPQMKITEGAALPGTANYFMGSEPANWYTDLATYSNIVYEQLYPGIDLHYSGTQGVLKGTYIVAAGADPAQIRWRYGGVDNLHVDPATGDLMIAVDTQAALIERAPVAWQMIDGQQIPVDIRYTLNNDQSVQFTLGAYDAAYPLTLDPELQYTTYIGGISTDVGSDIAVDNYGNAYIVGVTGSSTFPTIGAIQGALSGSGDAFISKVNSSGRTIFSTYFGGRDYDSGTGIAVDSTGIYLVGQTQSTDFPTSTGAYQISNDSVSTDAFVTKISLTGANIIYSTYLGGSGFDGATDIAVSNGYAHVTGKTNSANFDIRFANQSNLGGGDDAFVTKLDTTGQTLMFSTYLGGVGTDIGEAIAIAPDNSVYITGHTLGVFPVNNALYSSKPGLLDAFITKYNSSGTLRLFSTYLGSAMDDAAYGLVIDAAGNAYITGETKATHDFPVPSGGLTSNGGADVFVAEVFHSGGATTPPSLVFSTLIGGNADDGGAGIALDDENNVYVTGSTKSADFPVANYFTGYGTYQGTIDTDAFVLKLLAGTSALEYSSYLGGPNVDRGLRIAVDTYGATMVLGNTASNTMFAEPLTQFGGGYDAFIVRIGSLAADLKINKLDDNNTPNVGDLLTYTITVTNTGPDTPGETVVTDTLPYQISFVSVSIPPEKGTCSESEGVVTCNLLDLAPYSPAEITLKATVVVSGIFFNTAYVSSDLFDPVDDNQHTQQTTGYAVADLELDMRSDTIIPASGDTVTFTLTLTNNGPSAASNVRVADILPAGLTYSAHNAPVGSFNPSTGVWQISILNAGSSADLTLQAIVDGAIGTKIINSASATSNQTDDNQGNNSASVTLTLTSGLPLSGCHPSKLNPNVVLCLTG